MNGNENAIAIRQEADREKNHAALSSVLWALFLTCIKLVAGLATNSLGILSEALHSGLDLVAAGITFVAVRVASRPADKGHPYGYGKVESLSALVETLLLLVTCGWIVREAVERLFFDAPEVTPSWWGMGVIAVSLVVDINRSRMLHRVAKKHNSQALEADAMHFTTDIWSSAVVLLGLACVWASSFLPSGHPLTPVLHMADAGAALVVSGIVVVVGAKLCRRAVASLLDGGARRHTEIIEQALMREVPLYGVRRLRVRESGSSVFVDLVITVPASLPLDAAHGISCEVEAVVREAVAEADVTVHVEPAVAHEDSILQLARTLAAARDLSIHNLVLSTDGDNQLVFVHVEAPPAMRLDEAHALVDAFEQTLARRLGTARIITHIEPDDRLGWQEASCPANAEAIRAAVDAMMPQFPSVRDLHDLRIYRIGDTPLLSFHCHVDASLTVAEAHELASRMEAALRKIMPELGRILIHTDPDGVSETA